MVRVLTIFGTRVITNANKKVFVRKRLFHKGYQINSVYWDKQAQEEYFELILELPTFDSVQKWIQNN